jgi:hypothetical protein
LKILLPVIIAIYCSLSAVYSQELKNPLALDNEWPGYSIGDPYVLKHRGVFYLYCSTKDSETGIKCWSSRDLVDWSYEGLCATDPITKGAYAPEVIYWNGVFYMYTSPAGNGHYVLSAPSPTGPFEIITSNLGKTIDGSVYIDDEGQLYFYHASSQGILGCPMPSPSSIGASQNLGTQMNKGWTEGPCVFKRNDVFYLVYTGNHVISRGYRIDYASNTSGPIDSYEPAVLQNPILLDALGLHTGLGHGSVFIGPDLDSYYLTYHNLVSGIGPFRRLNFDRIAWNGKKMTLLGPTTFFQENPAMPHAYDFFDRAEPGSGWTFPNGGNWYIHEMDFLVQDSAVPGSEQSFLAVMDSATGEDYSAEFNFRGEYLEGEPGKIGAVFGYSDISNYGTVLLNSGSNQLEIGWTSEGVSVSTRMVDLPEGFNPEVWHTLRIEKYVDRYRFFIDGMLKDSLSGGPGAGRLGYLTSNCRGNFGFIAFSNLVNGSGTFDVYKPVPGKIAAIQYRTGGEGTGFHREYPDNAPSQVLRVDEVDLVPSSLGGYAVASLETGDWFSYHINVELDRKYNLEVYYASEAENNRVRFLLNGSPLPGSFELPDTGGGTIWRSAVFKDLELPKGFHTLTMEVLEGSFHFYSMQFFMANNVPFEERISFDGSFGPGWKYTDGNWVIQDKKAVIDGFGKRTYGSDGWRDYTVEVDLKFTRSMNAGLIFRVQNPALGGAGNDPALGTDYLQGYFVGFNFGSVVLGKHNYGWQMLTSTSGSYATNTWYHLRVLAEGPRIRVFVDDMTQSVIDYTDSLQLVTGMAGLRSFNTGVEFDNFHVTSDMLTGLNDRIDGQELNGRINLYPNPSEDFVMLEFTGDQDYSITLFDMRGTMLISDNSNGKQITKISLGDLHPGIYLVQVTSRNGKYFQKLVVQ